MSEVTITTSIPEEMKEKIDEIEEEDGIKKKYQFKFGLEEYFRKRKQMKKNWEQDWKKNHEDTEDK